MNLAFGVAGLIEPIGVAAAARVAERAAMRVAEQQAERAVGETLARDAGEALGKQMGEAAARDAEQQAVRPALDDMGRLPQDVRVDPRAPDALPLNRPIGRSATQNEALQTRIAELQQQRATDIRVNQQ